MHFFSLFTLMTLMHVLIIIGVSFRVIQVRLPVADIPGLAAAGVLLASGGRNCLPGVG
jgi:hypothetical protein